MAANLPKFICVGTAKAGTTSVYHYLKQHPGIEIPVKETFHFIEHPSLEGRATYPIQRRKGNIVRNIADYDSIYEGIDENAIVGEIGTGYLYFHKSAIPNLKERLGDDIRVFAIIRNPVERCWSAFQHFRKDLHEPLTFSEALGSEQERIDEHRDFMWHYAQVGMYASQLEAYENAFKNFKVFLYDDLIRDPKGFMNELTEHIGASPFDFNTKKQFNRSAEPRSAGIQRLITHENPIKKTVRPLVRAIIPKKNRMRIRKRLRRMNEHQSVELPAMDRNNLIDLYRDDITRTSTLINRDLSHWTE